MAVERVIKGVHVVPMGKANAFLIKGDDGLTPIDADYPGISEPTSGQSRAGRSPDQLRAPNFHSRPP